MTRAGAHARRAVHTHLLLAAGALGAVACSGNDRITSLDNARDRVDCGTGRDSVLADRRDVVSRSCERVRRR